MTIAPPAILWNNCTQRYWGSCKAWGGRRHPALDATEATFGAVVLTVIRSAGGRWSCRCPLFAADLDAGDEVQAREMAVARLREVVGEIQEALS